MEKGNQLTCTPLVRLWKVEILEIKNKTIAVLWSVDSSRVATNHHAHLSELLQDMGRRSLCTAVYDCHLCRPLLLQTVLQQHSTQ